MFDGLKLILWKVASDGLVATVAISILETRILNPVPLEFEPRTKARVMLSPANLVRSKHSSVYVHETGTPPVALRGGPPVKLNE
jgi:hypothetical protein